MTSAHELRVVYGWAELRATVAELRAADQPILFVPTMGALHAGHASLVRWAASLGPTVASIFVNPTQFGQGEDFETYPRDAQGDRAVLAAAGAAVSFEPTVETIYPPGDSTRVNVSGVTGSLCGLSRPGHFEGVATVVTKLLAMVAPDVAVFGSKDAQQCLVLARLVRDLHLPVRLLFVPTVREPDGLALSSRNRRLDPQERQDALCVSAALRTGRAVLEGGERRREAVESAMRQVLSRQAREDYAEVRTLPDLGQQTLVDGHVLLAAAAHVGSVRLIDNMVLAVEGDDVRDAPLVEEATYDAVRRAIHDDPPRRTGEPT